MIPQWLDPTFVTQDPIRMVGLVFAGLVIGAVGGLFGVSGCFLLMPILAEVFGIPYKYAVGSASVHAVGIAATGLRKHLRIGGVDLKLGMMIACGAMVGSFCGSQIMVALTNVYSAEMLDTTMRIVMIALLGLVAFMVSRPAKGDGHRTLAQRVPFGPRRPVPGKEDRSFSIPAAILLAVVCGLVAGFLGLGGGVMYLPMMILAIGATPHAAVRVTLVVTLFSAIASTIGHTLAGHASLAIAMLLMVGSSIGVQIGSQICHKIHGDGIRKYFVMVVLTAMAMVAWKLIKSLLG